MYAVFSIAFAAILAVVAAVGNLGFSGGLSVSTSGPSMVQFTVTNTFAEEQSVVVHLYNDGEFDSYATLTIPPGNSNQQMQFVGPHPTESVEVVLDPDNYIVEDNESNSDNKEYLCLSNCGTPNPTGTPTGTATGTPTGTPSSTPTPTGEGCETNPVLSWVKEGNNVVVNLSQPAPVHLYIDAGFNENVGVTSQVIVSLDDFIDNMEVVANPDCPTPVKLYLTKEQILGTTPTATGTPTETGTPTGTPTETGTPTGTPTETGTPTPEPTPEGCVDDTAFKPFKVEGGNLIVELTKAAQVHLYVDAGFRQNFPSTAQVVVDLDEIIANVELVANPDCANPLRLYLTKEQILGGTPTPEPTDNPCQNPVLNWTKQGNEVVVHSSCQTQFHIYIDGAFSENIPMTDLIRRSLDLFDVSIEFVANPDGSNPVRLFLTKDIINGVTPTPDATPCANPVLSWSKQGSDVVVHVSCKAQVHVYLDGVFTENIPLTDSIRRSLDLFDNSIEFVANPDSANPVRLYLTKDQINGVTPTPEPTPCLNPTLTWQKQNNEVVVHSSCATQFHIYLDGEFDRNIPIGQTVSVGLDEFDTSVEFVAAPDGPTPVRLYLTKEQIIGVPNFQRDLYLPRVRR